MLAKRIPHSVKLSSGKGTIRTVEASDGSAVRVLEVGGVYQSATYTDERWAEPVFSYYRSFDTVFQINPAAERLLMIGGGGFAWPKHVAATNSKAILDVVELDPKVIEIAEKYFYLEEALSEYPGSINAIADDGRAYLEAHAAPETIGATNHEAKCYDGIVIDAFEGTVPVRSLATAEAFGFAKRCMTKQAALLINVVSEDGGENVDYLRDLVATAREVFAHVYVVSCEEDPFAIEDNYILVATDSGTKPLNTIPYDMSFLGTVMHDEA